MCQPRCTANHKNNHWKTNLTVKHPVMPCETLIKHPNEVIGPPHDLDVGKKSKLLSRIRRAGDGKAILMGVWSNSFKKTTAAAINILVTP